MLNPPPPADMEESLAGKGSKLKFNPLLLLQGYLQAVTLLTHQVFESDFIVSHQVLRGGLPVLQGWQVHLKELWVQKKLHGLFLPCFPGVLVLRQ